MKRFRTLLSILVVTAFGVVLSACSDNSGGEPITLYSGSENKSLYPIVEDFAKKQGVDIKIKSLGSVDIMLDIRKGVSADADIVWPAASLWLELGDVDRVIKHERSIMRSPVVFWTKKSKAEALGWTDNPVSMDDIVKAVDDGLTFGMTSATQSNSGAMGYFAMLSAAAETPGTINLTDIEDPGQQAHVAKLLKQVSRTSGSSGWLGDLYLDHPSAMDAMFNYEAVGLEVNRELVAKGEEPLCAIYPVDGLAIADSPLAYVDKGDEARDEKIEAFFVKLQEHLLTADIQAQLAASGRRVGPLGLSSKNLSTEVFKADYCIDLKRPINVLTLPNQKVIEAALRTYQSTTRRPSEIVFLLDYSGSMEGEGNKQMVSALENLLKNEIAETYFLETTQDDIFYSVPFSSYTIPAMRASGASDQELADLYADIERRAPGGGTNIYLAVAQGLDILSASPHSNTHSQMVLLLTDGISEGDPNLVWQRLSASASDNVPVFSILFGDASEDQVSELARMTAARVFDGRKGLVKAFRQARGYAN